MKREAGELAEGARGSRQVSASGFRSARGGVTHPTDLCPSGQVPVREAHRLRQVSDECGNLTTGVFDVPDRKVQSGIEAHFTDLQSQRQRSDEAAAAKQRKIDEGVLLDIDREIARSGADLTGKSPDEIVRALNNAPEIGTGVDSYLGDSVESLTDANLKPWKTYGASRHSASSNTRARKPKRERGRPFLTKESEPREIEVPTRVTQKTREHLRTYERETGHNPSDVLMMFADLHAAASNGNHSASFAVKIFTTYGRKIRVGELDKSTKKMLSVALKGLPEEAA
jgi:hypothetical protein